MMIYLDNAASTQVADEVMTAMEPYHSTMYGNAHSLHTLGTQAREAIEKAKKTIADKINAYPEEIIFTSGATESNTLVLSLPILEGNHMITSSIEHSSIIKPAQQMNSTLISVNNEGRVDPQSIIKAITDKTKLISIMHANNETGMIQPIQEIGAIAKKKKILFHTDAVQSFTKTDIDVEKMNIDFLSLSAHKIHGPKGIGVLYCRRSLKQVKIIRNGTENVPGIVGFAAAVHLNTSFAHLTSLRDTLIDGILSIPGTRLNGNTENMLSHIVNISFKNIDCDTLMMRLNHENVCVSTGAACMRKEKSHVLRAMGTKNGLRFSLSRYTTIKDITTVIKKLKEIIT